MKFENLCFAHICYNRDKIKKWIVTFFNHFYFYNKVLEISDDSPGCRIPRPLYGDSRAVEGDETVSVVE